MRLHGPAPPRGVAGRRSAHSAASDGVTGRVCEAEAGRITVMEGWGPGPTDDRGTRRSPAEAGETVRRLLADAEKPGQVYGAS
ncbi:hypothetical protein SBADM41S_10799 [Streptomyces badius]